MLFKNGAPVDKMEGLPSEAQIMERIEAMLRQK